MRLATRPVAKEVPPHAVQVLMQFVMISPQGLFRKSCNYALRIIRNIRKAQHECRTPTLARLVNAPICENSRGYAPTPYNLRLQDRRRLVH